MSLTSCIAGAILAACNPSANMVIAGAVAYAPPSGGGWVGYYALPSQFVPPVVIIRRA
jgi:hypothetical protein